MYCGNTIANGFGGLLAAGILSGLDGASGLAGWRYISYLTLCFGLLCALTDNNPLDRWLFIIEGAGTILAGFLAVWLLPDFPGSGKQSWLSDQEQRFAEWRLAQEANSEFDENGSVKEGLIDAFTDPKAWVLVGIQICQLTSQTWTYFFPVSTKPSFTRIFRTKLLQ